MSKKESKKHTKHTALIKPLGGEYHRHEWAILGAPCGVIHQLVEDINTCLKKELNLGYLDAAHQAPEQTSGFYSTYTDKIAYQQFETKTKPEQKQSRKFFNDLDILLVNGNHFKGAKQIVLINEKKKESLSRKLDRLTNVQLVLVEKEGDVIHDYLESVLPKNIPVLPIGEINQICNLIRTDFETNIPPLYGLVLAGGKSQRMGTDKGALTYYDKPHREYLADLLQQSCEAVYLSCRQDQIDTIQTNYPKLRDTFTGLGPYGAILSAFRERPNHAWLTIACDLPHLNAETLDYLVRHRNPSRLATCFHNPDTKFPEPLITIWEPRAYPVLLEFLSQGYSCPRKVLINSEIEELQLTNTDYLINANDETAYEAAKAKISQHKTE